MPVLTEEELRKYVSEGWRAYYHRKRDVYYLYNPKERKCIYVRKKLNNVVKQLLASRFVKPAVSSDDIALLTTGVAALSFCSTVIEREAANLSSSGRTALYLLKLVISQLIDVVSRVRRVEQGA